MVRLRKPDPSDADDIQRLSKTPSFQLLVAAIESGRDEYFSNLARGLGASSLPIDQREIDEKRGFWKGALWALKSYPQLAERTWEAHVKDALKEAEELA